MEEEIISFETAKLAKEKGFNQWCRHRYNKEKIEPSPWLKSNIVGKPLKMDQNQIFAPTQSLLAKWLREKHNKYISISHDILPSKDGIYYIVDWGTIRGYDGGYSEFVDYKTYEEALEAGLQEALK